MIAIYSISLGCPKNRVDTERTLGILQSLLQTDHRDQAQFVPTPEQADLVFINTCGFIAPAVEESVRVILEHAAIVDALPSSGRPLLAVAGCLVGRYGVDALAPDLPEVDLILDNKELDEWVPRLYAALRAKLPNLREPSLNALSPQVLAASPARSLSTGPSYAWLKISDGCRHACSFCTIPAIRGHLRSRPREALCAEAELLLSRGVKELILVAQDLTAYGVDRLQKNALIPLLETLLPLPGLARLRLMYLYPAGITKTLLDFLRQAGPPFVPYFDVPLQHAARGVLSRMGRPFALNPSGTVDAIRSVFPEAALRTSIITGFPGETPQDFDLLCRFVEQTRFQHLGVFAYHPEEGTPAADMPDQIPDAEKEYRRDLLMSLQSEISEDLLSACQGQRLPILVDSASDEWPGLYLGRAWFQAPEIDGLTYISGPGVAPGELIEADIIESKEYDLVALSDAVEE